MTWIKSELFPYILESSLLRRLIRTNPGTIWTFLFEIWSFHGLNLELFPVILDIGLI